MISDLRYALRGIRRSPLFAASAAATIGLGLGVLCSAFTILNAYVFEPVDLPDARALYGLSWDTSTTARHRFRLADFDAARESASTFVALTAGQEAAVTQDGAYMPGLLVAGDYFQILGAQPILGRTLVPSDATSPGASPVAVLAEYTWRSRYGADPGIVGQRITLGRQQFEVVGVIRRGMNLPAQQSVTFWAPLTMARAFDGADPWADPNAASLFVVGRLRPQATESQAHAWFDVWLRQRFPPDTEFAPTIARFESRSTLLPPTGGTWTMLVVFLTAFGLVLLVACANVTNLMLARGFTRQREIAVRLSLGANRWRVVRLLIIESLVLAAPAAAVGLALTYATARIFPALIVATFPRSVAPVEVALVPLDPNFRVLAMLCVAAVVSAVLVGVTPAIRVTRANLVRASRGEPALDVSRSTLRTGLVAMQIGVCLMFLIGAIALVQEAKRLGNPNPGFDYVRVAELRIAPRFREDVARHLASDPLIKAVAAVWQPPLTGPLRRVGVIPSQTRIEQTVGSMVVSPDYFAMFDVEVVRGRVFTTREADERAPVAMVSAATAQVLWPGLDPIGQTLELRRLSTRPEGLPAHASVRIVGVTEDVINGTLIEGIDRTCVYFPTSLRSAEMTMLVMSHADVNDVRTAGASAMKTLDPDAPYRIMPMRDFIGLLAWTFQAFSATATLLGVIGLVLAFSGTYAVVAFLVAQRTPEFGIRMALGASVTQIVSAMMSETLRVALIGLSAGLVVAFGLVRLLSAATDAVPRIGMSPYVVGVAIVLAATAVAALLPSLRASRIDPSKALRAE